MTLFKLVTPYINILRDIIFIIVSINNVKLEKKHTTKRFCVILLCLFAYFMTQNVKYIANILPFTNLFSEMILNFIRFAIKFGSIYTIIRLSKRIKKLTAMYCTLVLYSVIQATHNIFLTPFTRPVYNGTVAFTDNDSVNYTICFALMNIISIIIFAVVNRLMPLSKLRNINIQRIILLLIIVLVSQFLNSSLKVATFTDASQKLEFSIYVILLVLLLLGWMIYNEHYQTMLKENARINLENKAAHSLLESIEIYNKNAEELSRIRHDLKNHLLSISSIIKSGDIQAAQKYIDTVYGEINSYHPVVISGNKILDGILSQKISFAEQNEIPFSVSADFSYLEGIEDAEKCILFGNLIDNAIEASMKVPVQNRFINLRNTVIGETVVFSIENSYTGHVSFLEHVPLTTKEDKANHGVGISSANKVVKKYDGTMSFSAENGIFHTLFSFPVSIKEVNNKNLI